MNRIAIGMSGGVDSAVAAALLIDKGFDVEVDVRVVATTNRDMISEI